MARIRNIKPEFFTSEAVSELPLRARLTWIGLWVHCDNHGRARDNVKLIKGQVWPLDSVGLKDIEDDLDVLAEHGRIVRYEVDGKRYLVVPNWGEHQYGAFKDKPKYPPPPDDSGCDRETSGDGLDISGPIQGLGVKGQGGGTRGRATPPPSRCPRHLKDLDPPACVPCKNARLNREQWDQEQAQRAKALSLVVAECNFCDGDGFRFEPGRRTPMTPYVRCDHSEQEAEA